MIAPVSCLELLAANLRRKLLLSSMAGVVAALLFLGAAFHVSQAHVPPVVASPAATCAVPDLADCTDCLRHGCVFNTIARSPSLTKEIWSCRF